MPRSPVAGLGVGAGWRPAIADEILAQSRTGMRFSEVVAENVSPARPARRPWSPLVRRGSRSYRTE